MIKENPDRIEKNGSEWNVYHDGGLQRVVKDCEECESADNITFEGNYLRCTKCDIKIGHPEAVKDWWVSQYRSDIIDLDTIIPKIPEIPKDSND